MTYGQTPYIGLDVQEVGVYCGCVYVSVCVWVGGCGCGCVYVSVCEGNLIIVCTHSYIHVVLCVCVCV